MEVECSQLRKELICMRAIIIILAKCFPSANILENMMNLSRNIASRRRKTILKWKSERITVSFDSEKMQAIKIFAPDVYENIEEQMTEYLEKIYQKAVPQNARTYIDEIVKTEKKSATKKNKNI